MIIILIYFIGCSTGQQPFKLKARRLKGYSGGWIGESNTSDEFVSARVK